MRTIVRIASLVVLSLPRLALAEGCHVDKNSNEAKLLAYYAAPLAFTPSGTIGELARGRVRLGFELTLIPKPGSALETTKKCFVEKHERTQLSPVFPRPHLTVGLGKGFFIEGMYLPPVTVADATPNMASAAIGFVHTVSGVTGLAARVHGTFGHVKGPITCPVSVLQLITANEPCYGSVPSEDTYSPNILGGEVALTYTGRGRLSGYAGAGVSSYKPRFRVGFHSGDGYFDHTLVLTDLTRVAAMAGGNLRIGKRGALTAELYSVPTDLTTLRVGGTWLVR